MAKYTIMMSCGHEETIDLIGKVSDRERKIEYFQRSGLCKECYKKKMEAKNEAKPLSFCASVLPYINNKDGSILLSVWFDGNTKPHKEDIKSLGGYRWAERESADDFYSVDRTPLCWNKIIKFEELENEAKKAVSIGAENLIPDNGFFSTVHYQMALDLQKKWKEKHDKLARIEKPQVPDVLSGHRWNQKVYGKPGIYSIYLDGDKVNLSDDQVEEIKKYLAAKEEYIKKVKEIENEKEP